MPVDSSSTTAGVTSAHIRSTCPAPPREGRRPSRRRPVTRSRLSGTAPWIAMYHSVADTNDDPYRVTVSPRRLDEQLYLMRRAGLRGVSVARLLAAGAPRGMVGLTFDDGYQDFVGNALPLLLRYDCTATVFVLPGRLGGENTWDPLGPRKPLLDAAGIRRAAASGMEIASHGLTHTDLTRADGRLLATETTRSRVRLRELTGHEVYGFCYPYGAVDAQAMAAVRRAGYRYACAIAPGRLSGTYALPRAHIGQEDTAWRLTAKRLLAPLRRPVPVFDLEAP